MGKLKLILSFIAAVAVGILLFASTKPDTFRIERSAAIKAPPERIYPHIADLRAFTAWSPFEKLDPGMKRSFTGAANGKGAAYAWEGDSKAGAGRMEIVEATAPSKVAMKLDFLKPFEAHNMAEFTLVPQGDTTRVTWAMHGPSPFMMKVMHVFFDMDTMVGKDFDAGLANLKALTEK